jgi:hypothetical protein
MFENMSRVSSKKIISLVAVLAIGCGGIAYFGSHQGAHKAPPLVLKTLEEATEGDLRSLTFDNLNMADVREVSPLVTLYKGTFYLPDTESIVKTKAESFFKKQAKAMKIRYDKSFFKPYNTKYSPPGCDYEVNDDITMSYSKDAFFTCIRNFDVENLYLPYNKAFDLNGKVSRKNKDKVDKLTEKVNTLLGNTGRSFDISLSPHKFGVSKTQDGRTVETLYYQLTYKGIPFVDVLGGEKYFPWFCCAISSVNDSRDGEFISLEGMSLRAKKLVRVDRVISVSDAVRLLSEELAGHKKYDVSSVQMEYMTFLTEKERKLVKKRIIRDREEGNAYTALPYWAIYLDTTPNDEIVGYVNAENGDVLFVNNR